MDLTTLTMFFMLIASAIGADTVLHPTSVVLEAAVAGKLDKLSVDAETLNSMLTYEVMRICSTPSVLAAPEIRAGANKGVGMAIAEAVHLQSVAIAMQTMVGYQPEQIKLTLLAEDGVTKLLVSGSGMGGRIRTPPFQEQLILGDGETLTQLVHRAALVGMTRIDPYVTALYLLQSHIEDMDFGHAETLVNQIKAQLPQTPTSYDRSILENLQGIMAVFRDQFDVANDWFHRASNSDPDNAAAALNAGFIDLQVGDYPLAARHIEALLSTRTPQNATLLAMAYITWAAALVGQNDVAAAEHKLGRAVQIDPFNSTAYALWSEIKRRTGDTAAADDLHAQAWAAASAFRYYSEVVALYFQIPVQPGRPLQRVPFSNPATIRFN